MWENLRIQFAGRAGTCRLQNLNDAVQLILLANARLAESLHFAVRCGAQKSQMPQGLCESEQIAKMPHQHGHAALMFLRQLNHGFYLCRPSDRIERDNDFASARNRV